MTMKFGVVGDGAWGTAIALLLAQESNHRVVLWSAREENARILRERRENVRLLPGVSIPAAVELTTDLEQAEAEADLSIAAIPTIYLRATLERVKPFLQADRPVLMPAKGLEHVTFLRPTGIVSDLL